MLKLRVDLGTGEPIFATVADGTHCVGRRAECSVRLAHDTVSNRHAELVVSGASARIRDLASTGGVFVNAETVKQAVLKVGDVIRLGTVILRVESLD